MNAAEKREQTDLQWLTGAIEAAAQTGLRPDGEYWRATYTKEDNKVVDLLRQYMTEAGMEVYSDAVGNLFGRFPGESEEVILVGSHRDTVRQGGRYDGILGVLTAIRAAASLHAELGRPRKTLEVVATCEEESSRFLTSYLGSHHICGDLQEESLKDMDKNGISLKEAMQASGYLKEPLSRGRQDIDHFVELHIEQGGVLEHEKKQIGIVTSIVGLLCTEIRFFGHQNHAGTTPMALRKDPVPTAAAYISRLFDWARQYMDDTVCTIGQLRTLPGSANVIPESVTISIDIRSARAERLSEAQQVLQQLKKELEESIDIQIAPIECEQPVLLDEEGVRTLTALAQAAGMSYQVMPSGAGHDSQVIGLKYKTNMIFVPSVEGISHNPKEYTKPEDLNAGMKLLRAYIKKLAWQG